VPKGLTLVRFEPDGFDPQCLTLRATLARAHRRSVPIAEGMPCAEEHALRRRRSGWVANGTVERDARTRRPGTMDPTRCRELMTHDSPPEASLGPRAGPIPLHRARRSSPIPDSPMPRAATGIRSDPARRTLHSSPIPCFHTPFDVEIADLAPSRLRRNLI
jgi:hypothetical protein